MLSERISINQIPIWLKQFRTELAALQSSSTNCFVIAIDIAYEHNNE